jgi:hypothetical protein
MCDPKRTGRNADSETEESIDDCVQAIITALSDYKIKTTDLHTVFQKVRHRLIEE